MGHPLPENGCAPKDGLSNTSEHKLIKHNKTSDVKRKGCAVHVYIDRVQSTAIRPLNDWWPSYRITFHYISYRYFSFINIKGENRKTSILSLNIPFHWCVVLFSLNINVFQMFFKCFSWVLFFLYLSFSQKEMFVLVCI